MFNLVWESHKILTHGSTWTFRHEWVSYDDMSNAEWILLPEYIK
jgi:hypothetical protein